MRKEHSKLIDKVVKSLDWDSIYDVYKAFKMGVGEGSSVVPGIKRKPFSDSLTKEDIRNELKVIIKHIVSSDISDLVYGPWIINWINGDWAILDEDEDGEKIELSEDEMLIVNSKLEVIFAPQRISMMIDSIAGEYSNEEESDIMKIELMMQKALQAEDYELASKFRDILKYQNKELDSDK
jgi:hypothetical protein